MEKSDLKKMMKIDHENTNVNMPMKTVLSLIVLVAAFTFSYFQITERLNNLETANELMKADLLKKAEQTPKNLEMFMLIEHSAKQIEKHQVELDNNIHTKVLLAEAERKILKIEEDVEDLKNKFRKVNGGRE